MSSDFMDHLRKQGGDVGCDLAPQRLGGAAPHAFGSDEHAATPLSSAKATSSSTASTVSLLSPPSGSRGARLVAATGNLSCIRPW
jgi:hypothetical protein